MQKWKFVTMFFPLDCAYKKRSVPLYNGSTFYKSQFENLQKIGIELVVYTDEETEKELQPKCGENVTFVVRRLSSLHAMSYIEDVERITQAHADSRCIPEWALVTCSKVQVMNEIAQLYSDYVLCWIDFGFYRTEHPYVDYSAGELAVAFHNMQDSDVYQKGMMHFGVIDWVSSVEELYARCACTVCGQLFFGDYNAIKKFHDVFYKQLEVSIQKGTFHNDEQIYYEILCQYPQLFTLFPTDYFVSPFNVIMPTKHLYVSKNLLFPNLLKDAICGEKIMCRFNSKQISTVLFS